jgi:hypothetical protein
MERGTRHSEGSQQGVSNKDRKELPASRATTGGSMDEPESPGGRSKEPWSAEKDAECKIYWATMGLVS